MAPTEDEHERTRLRVRRALRDLGATDGEITDAERQGTLDLLAVERVLFPPGPRYTQAELAEMTELPADVLQRLWRALGFLDVAESERVFTDLDVEAATLFRDLLRSGVVGVEPAVQLARVIGSSMSRIAEAEVFPRILSSEGTDPEASADAFVSLIGPAVPSLGHMLEFVWRRHLLAATRRSLLLKTHGQLSGSTPVMSVGFADMVGFTLLSQHLTDAELAEVVDRFEELSHDVVTRMGGHVVKMIGDEVMFVVDGVVPAARIALELSDAHAADDVLSDVRIGLAVGSVLTTDGDYFGPTVNLAHRIVNIAAPGTVIASDQFQATLEAQAAGEFAVEPLRPRVLKDLGRVHLWWIGRPGQAMETSGDTGELRRQERFERLAEVLRDLGELRDTGEKAVTSGLSSVMTTPRRPG